MKIKDLGAGAKFQRKGECDCFVKVNECSNLKINAVNINSGECYHLDDEERVNVIII